MLAVTLAHPCTSSISEGAGFIQKRGNSGFGSWAPREAWGGYTVSYTGF